MEISATHIINQELFSLINNFLQIHKKKTKEPVLFNKAIKYFTKQILKNKKAQTSKGSAGNARKRKGLVFLGKMGFLNSVGYQIQTQVQ